MWDEVDPRRGAVAPAAVRSAGAVHYADCAAAAAVIHKGQRHAHTRDAISAAATASAPFARRFGGPAARSERRSRQGSGSESSLRSCPEANNIFVGPSVVVSGREF